MRDETLVRSLDRTLRTHTVFGLAVVALLVVGLGGWSALTGISGAVVAPGSIVVETGTKRVQHSEGGIIKTISVKDGEFVEAGTPLLQFDDTIIGAGLQIVRGQLDQLSVTKARLEAEAAGAVDMMWSQRIEKRRDDPEISAIMEGQIALIESRRASIEGRRTQLSEQIRQIETQVEGLGAQRDATAEEILIIEGELASLVDLEEQGLVRATRVNELRRDRSALKGEHGRLVSEIARARETIGERRIQALQIVDEFNAEVLEQLQDTRSQIAELGEREIAAHDRLARLEITAPRSGTIHNLSVHTIGGVVSAGETILEIVPRQDRLIIEAQIAPADVDQVLAGQKAGVRFPGLDRRTTPELEGTVLSVSPDSVRDPETQAVFYEVRLQLNAEEVGKLGSVVLIPGMPIEAFIRTSDRTVLSYLVKPIFDQIAHAFREE
jgi:HlyD family type I secretion membrane fusion protein